MLRRTFLGGVALAYNSFLSAARERGTSRAPKLKIREVRAVRLRGGFNSRFVRVYTDQGLTGTGETLDTAGAEYIINQNIGPMLVGLDPLDIEAIVYHMWGWKRTQGYLSPVFLRGLGGPYFTAMSGVEMALWDLAGKAMGVPVYRLLGGRVREKVPVYLHAVDAAEARQLIAGHKIRALKIGMDYKPDQWTLDKGWDPGKAWGVSLNNTQLDDIVKLVASVREAVGQDYPIMLECHTRYDTESAIQLCHLLEPYRLTFVEEPVPAENVDAMAKIRSSVRVPIAAGENIYSRFGFRPFFEKQAISVAQPDMSKTGGLLEAKRISEMAATYYVPVAPHGVASPLGTMAYAHVDVTIPNLLTQEWTHYLNKNFTSLTDPVQLTDGYLAVPDSPGIGVELNEDAVKERMEAGFQPL